MGWLKHRKVEIIDYNKVIMLQHRIKLLCIKNLAVIIGIDFLSVIEIIA